LLRKFPKFKRQCVASPANSSMISDYIARLDGFTVISGGWINKHYIQLGYQLAGSAAGLSYSFVGTCVILFFINLIPGLSIRCDLESELGGVDAAECGEFAYDYVEITRETPATGQEIEGVEGSSHSEDSPAKEGKE
jgi:Amt family ammonium transporter